MEIYRHIETVLKSHRQGHSRMTLKTCVRLPDVLCKFLCLSVNARPGFLYDYGALSRECARDVTYVLSEEVEPLKNLVVVEYGCDYLFVLPDQLTEYWNMNCIQFINVDAHLPALVNQKLADVDLLVDKLRDWELRSADGSKLLILNHEDFQSGPAVFGLLIGYPTIYYTETEKNCLNDIPLLIVKCEITLDNSKYVVCSFTCPKSILDEEKSLSESVQLWMQTITNRFSRCDIECNVTTHVDSFPALAL